MDSTRSQPLIESRWFYWVVIGSSLLMTFAAWQVSKIQLEEKLSQRFEFQADQLMALISERMSRYEDVLRAGVATISAQTHGLDVNEWHRFAKTLQIHKSYPGINGIGVIYFVPPSGVSDYLEVMRRLRPAYRIHPEHHGDEYWPVAYVEPLDANKEAVGLDMAFEENRLQAAIKARDSNTTQITAPIVLVQDAKKTPGFLQYVPFYSSPTINSVEQRRQHIIGLVYAPFIMHELMEGTLAQKSRHLLFSVYDGDKKLYDELTPDNPLVDPEPLFKKQVFFDMYGRQWRFNIQTAKEFRSDIGARQSTVVLVCGLIIDGLLLILFLFLFRSNKRVTVVAQFMANKARINEQYFTHIFEAAPCGIIITNECGEIETLNPHAVTLLGYSKEELVGKAIESLVPETIRNKHQNHRRTFWDNPEQRRMGLGRNVYCLKKNGEQFPAEIGLAQFDGEDSQKVLVTIIDISTYVDITNELKRSNKDLSDFASVASHDLKAPLRGIMRLASWIEEDLGENTSEDIKKNLALLQNRTSRLEKLLDDLLTYSRIGRNLGEVRQVDVSEMVHSIFDLLEPPKGFALECKGAMPVFDTLVVPLEVIFRNLIGNAIKHHDKQNGVITLSVVEYPRVYEFTVRDDGPGIPSHLQAMVFDLFKTLKPRDVVEGSGMGLAIVEKMLEYHRCDIKIESDGVRGTRFIFTWPKPVYLNERKRL